MMTSISGIDGPELVMYGGAFDPPHSGHVDCVNALVELFPAAQILVVPTANPPGIRGIEEKTPGADFDERVRLCEQAFKGNTGVEVSRIEEGLPAPSYTVNTLRELDRLGKRLAMVIGRDQFLSLSRWHAAREIVSLTDLVVIPRGDEGISTDECREVMAELGIEKFSGAPPQSVKVSNKTWYFPQIKTSPAASRLIREALAGGADVPQGWLPKLVLDYIEAKGLYRS